MFSFPKLKFPSPGRVYIPYPHRPLVTARFRVRITNRGHRIMDYIARWRNTFLRRAGASLRQYVITSFKRKKNKNIHSAVGTAPYLHNAKATFIRPAIQWHVDYRKHDIAVGPAYSVAKLWGWKHEHGKAYGSGKHRAQYPKRPFMAPQFRRWMKYGYPTIMKDIASKIAQGK